MASTCPRRRPLWRGLGPRPAAVAVLLLLLQAVHAIPLSEFYPYGAAVNATSLPPSVSRDTASTQVHLRVPINFYDNIYDSIFVNTFGLLSFNTDIPQFHSHPFPLDYPVIAVFYANVDTTGTGTVSFYESEEAEHLRKAADAVTRSFAASTFQPTSVFVATWERVGYYSGGADKVNTFQVAVSSDGTQSYVEFLYDDIQWVRGVPRPQALPDAYPQVGFVAGDGRMFQVRGSGTSHIVNVNKWSNTAEPGRYAFRVGPTDNRQVVQADLAHLSDNGPEANATCSRDHTLCNTFARCTETASGEACCACNDGYFGNGLHCLPNEPPVRLLGQLSGRLNDLNITADLQAYMLVQDGRSYTALSRVPAELGAELQLLMPMALSVGWMFAKPSTAGAPNGFELSGGVLTHTIDQFFPQSGERLTITIRYLGLDVFDQLKADVHVDGRAPDVPSGYKVSVPESEETFVRKAPGVLEARSHDTYTLDSGLQHRFTLEQRVEYSECGTPAWLQPNPTEDLDHDGQPDHAIRMKASFALISYEANDSIVRFAPNSKVTNKLNDTDPCDEGRYRCGANTFCRPTEDSFECSCALGYEKLVTAETVERGVEECVDIDECRLTALPCSPNSRCTNNPGGFECVCLPGFEGNGAICEPVVIQRTCAELGCDPQYGDCRDNRCFCVHGYEGDGYRCRPVQQQPDYGRQPDPRQPDDRQPDYRQPDPRQPDYRQPDDRQPDPRQPDYRQPDDRQPDYRQPDPRQPDYRQPDDRQPDPRQPDYRQPDDRQPDYRQPDPRQPDYRQPDDRQPDYRQPDPRQPDDRQPDYSQPDPRQPDPRQPDYRQPDYRQPEPQPYPGSYSLAACVGPEQCSPHGACVLNERTNTQACVCLHGYEGDGLNCHRVELQPVAPHCDADNTCDCPDKYMYDFVTDQCLPDIAPLPVSEVSCQSMDTCHPHALCLFVPALDRHQCVCNVGFSGDGMECTRNAESCLQLQDCHPYADCVLLDHEEGYGCKCRQGFKGDGRHQCVVDEPPGCEVTRDCHPDAHCVPVGSKFQCVCSAGTQGDGKQCVRTTPPGCEVLQDCGRNAECLRTRGEAAYHCQCVPGFVGDGYRCAADTTRQRWEQDRERLACDQPGTRRCVERDSDFMVVAQGMAMMKVPLLAPRTAAQAGQPLQIHYFQEAIGVDVDCEERRIYWGDVASKTIKSMLYNGTGITTFLDADIVSPEGLAVDWLSRNIYWADSSKDTIEVANLDTKGRTTLVLDGLVNPRGIALHPERGKLFWSDWDRAAPKLEWSNLDGSQREVFLQGNAVRLPNSLAIDFDRDELCWADAGTKSIECIGIDTMQRRTVANASYPFGLAMSEDNYFWTDWESSKVESASRPGGAPRPAKVVPLGGSGKMYGLAVVPEQCRRLQYQVRNSCGRHRGSCKEDNICLPTNHVGDYRCVCPEKQTCTEE